MFVRTVGLIGVVALLLIGCTDGSDPATENAPVEEAGESDLPTDSNDTHEPEPDTDPEAESEPSVSDDIEPEPDVDPTVLAYFEAFATAELASLREMAEHAAEGSPAAVYADAQVAFRTIVQQIGESASSDSVIEEDDALLLCGGSESCTRFDGFVMEDGLLSSFAVDGVGVSERLAAGGPSDVQNDITVSLVAAYRTASDTLMVLLNITNDADQTVAVDVFDLEYVSPDGRQIPFPEYYPWNRHNVRPGATVLAAGWVPDEDIGGTVYLPGFPEESLDRYEWAIPLVPMS